MKRIWLCAAYVMTTLGASAQMMPNPYGMPVNLDTAKKLAAAAVAEATKKGFKMAVAVTDTNGDLVYFERMDSTQIASVQVAISSPAFAPTIPASWAIRVLRAVTSEYSVATK